MISILRISSLTSILIIILIISISVQSDLPGCPDVSVVAFDSPEFNIYAINDGMKVKKMHWSHFDDVIFFIIAIFSFLSSYYHELDMWMRNVEQ